MEPAGAVPIIGGLIVAVLAALWFLWPTTTDSRDDDASGSSPSSLWVLIGSMLRFQVRLVCGVIFFAGLWLAASGIDA